MDQKKKVFKELLEKVTDTTLTDKLRVFREQHTVRGSEGNEDKLVLRQKMDSLSSNKKGKDKEWISRGLVSRGENDGMLRLHLEMQC